MSMAVHEKTEGRNKLLGYRDQYLDALVATDKSIILKHF
jgi:hypothetical protein